MIDLQEPRQGENLTNERRECPGSNPVDGTGLIPACPKGIDERDRELMGKFSGNENEVDRKIIIKKALQQYTAVRRRKTAAQPRSVPASRSGIDASTHTSRVLSSHLRARSHPPNFARATCCGVYTTPLADPTLSALLASCPALKCTRWLNFAPPRRHQYPSCRRVDVRPRAAHSRSAPRLNVPTGIAPVGDRDLHGMRRGGRARTQRNETRVACAATLLRRRARKPAASPWAGQEVQGNILATRGFGG
ncbi:hypothetical protein C8R47DRAFT_1190561 [Mycena vitilis]|nr:hypothetical protein C8R47DRAFT_1190561 [Mycena vitilis]